MFLFRRASAGSGPPVSGDTPNVLQRQLSDLTRENQVLLKQNRELHDRFLQTLALLIICIQKLKKYNLTVDELRFYARNENWLNEYLHQYCGPTFNAPSESDMHRGPALFPPLTPNLDHRRILDQSSYLYQIDEPPPFDYRAKLPPPPTYEVVQPNASHPPV